MVEQISLPRGTEDILPSEVHIWQYVENTARQVLHNYNYREIRTPLFEETGLFARSMGQTSDIVQKQMLNVVTAYKSPDENSESTALTLRPEATASIVRSYIQNSFNKKESLSKLYYIGPMFRGERPQKGRLRQFHQIGAEAIGPGAGSAYLDAEIIALCANILNSFSIKGFELKINSLGSLADKESFSKILREKLKPHVAKLSKDSQSRYERNVFRILDSKDEVDRTIVKSLQLDYSYLSKESRERYESVKESLKSLGVKFKEDICLVRGLDYYSHSVFEFIGTNLGSQDALAAGGRYNNLVQSLGGAEDVEAVGFALGMERALMAMGSNANVKEEKVTFFVIPLEEKAFSVAFRLLNDLRAENISGDMSFQVASMKSQMRQADKAGAKFTLILGGNELQNGSVMAKNMVDGQQQEIKIKDNLKELTEVLKG